MITELIREKLYSFLSGLSDSERDRAHDLLWHRQNKDSKMNPVLDMDLDQYTQIVMAECGVFETHSEFETIFNDTFIHVMGYASEKSQGVVDNWISGFNSDPEFPKPFICFYKRAVINATIAQKKKNRFILDTVVTKEDQPVISFASLDKELNEDFTLYSVVSSNNVQNDLQAKSVVRTLRDIQDIYGRDTVYGEILELFLSGVSRKEMVAYITKFGVNGRGGIHSEDSDYVVNPTEMRPINKITDSGEPVLKQMDKKAASAYDGNKIDIEIVPRYAGFSHQLLQFYLKNLKSFMHSYWNEFVAVSPEDQIDTRKQASTQFLNWQVTKKNTH